MSGPDTITPVPQKGRRTRAGILTVVLAVGLVVMILISAGTGQLHIPPAEVFGSIMHRIGLDIGPLPAHANGESALWNIRFPRVAMAVVIGAALAVAGLLMQAIFGNPLAEPGVVGVSSGAALGAATSIVFGWTFFGEWTTALMAFIAGLLATLVVYLMSRSGGRTEIVTLVLTGIAVNAFTGAGMALMTFLGDQQAREQIVFWQLGSLNGSRWEQLTVIVPPIVAGLIIAVLLARKLDLLSLGEKSARHLGVNVELLRIVVIVVTALLVGCAVAFAGTIAFVGLVVPHLLRMVIGPAHRPLAITSVLGGALLLVTADLIARTAVPMADLPIGMLTSLVGGPFFFYLLRRARRTSGGWA
ncbi:MAG: FecCD family ABC transporter permease [Mycetocola sp.]